MVAEALKVWLQDVMQILKPWVSSEDIRAGARWATEVARNLEQARFGILCLTRDNLSEPWVLFEAGALAKALDRSVVCPFLIDLKPTELEGPLVQFQAVRAVKSDTRKMLQAINEALGSQALSVEQVDRAFRKWWPELEKALDAVPKEITDKVDLRSEREILEEILDRVRRSSKSLGRRPSYPEEPILSMFVDDLFEGREVEALVKLFDRFGLEDDANAQEWFENELAPDQLDGAWFGRWSGGSVGDRWINGRGHLAVVGEYVYILTHDRLADCLIATRRRGKDGLVGRYINLGGYVNLREPIEVVPWVGRIVNEKRIDGAWTQGRWDFRR